MSIQHANVTDPNIHEPKGASTASANTVYLANGSGSGVWSPYPGYVLTGRIANVSTGDDIYIAVPISGNVVSVHTVLDDTIASADDTITIYNSDNESMGTITIANSGSGAGVVDSLVPVSNQDVLAGGTIRVNTNGASTSTASLMVTILVRPT